ncbi:MAG: hypothetical protein H0U72_11170 [Nitrosospira sp.]|nr:hypothetical protein [Nitrosospira sp.]
MLGNDAAVAGAMVMPIPFAHGSQSRVLKAILETVIGDGATMFALFYFLTYKEY